MLSQAEQKKKKKDKEKDVPTDDAQGVRMRGNRIERSFAAIIVRGARGVAGGERRGEYMAGAVENYRLSATFTAK